MRYLEVGGLYKTAAVDTICYKPFSYSISEDRSYLNAGWGWMPENTIFLVVGIYGTDFTPKSIYWDDPPSFVLYVVLVQERLYLVALEYGRYCFAIERLSPPTEPVRHKVLPLP